MSDHRPKNLQLSTLPGRGCGEIVVVAQRAPGDSNQKILSDVKELIGSHGGAIVSQVVHGIEREEIAHGGASPEPPWPVTWIEEGCDLGPAAAGTQVWALAGAGREPIEQGGRIVGTLYEDDDALFCRLGGLLPRDANAPPGEQARDVFDLMEECLQNNGFEFDQVVRTWFFNDQILSWYDEFNAVRSAFFTERDLFSKIVPASTGVGGSNSAGAALTSGLVAVKAKKGRNLKIEALPSPEQCPALEYGSSFSRAVEVASGGRRQLYVSGTASIAADGRTEYVGDVDGQVARTMEVVEAILHSRGMEWSDAFRGTAYFRNFSHAPRFARYCREKRIENLPVLIVRNVICRDDLLFEIEIDASRPL